MLSSSGVMARRRLISYGMKGTLGLWGVFEEAAEEIGEGEIALKRIFQHLGLQGCGNGEGG